MTLFDAIKSGDTATVANLLERDAALVHTRDDGGMSPLITATYYGRAEVIDLLLARGAEVDVFAAAALGRTERLRALLDQDAKLVDARSADGWTALHLATHFGQAETVKLLLARGASVHARSTNGLDNTALHAGLAGSGAAAVAPLLLDAGADVNDRQHGGYTPLHQAAQNGDAAMVRLLLERGADPTPKTDDGRDARDFAAGKADILALLPA